MTSSTRRAITALLATFAVVSAAAAQQSPAPKPGAVGPDTTVAIADQEARFERWKAELPRGTGPYRPARIEAAGLPGFTVFQPKSLARVKRKLPLLVFANGGCRNTPIEFTAFLAELASHGYAIVAVGRDDVPFLGFGATTTDSAVPLQNTAPDVLIKAIDLASAENSRKDGVFAGRLDLTRIAVVGQSCGGLQSLYAARDARVKTAVVLNSGAFAKAPPALKLVTLEDVSALRVPLAFFIGGPTDIAFANANANFDAAVSAPTLLANLPVGHTGAYPVPDARWSRAVLAWLDWRLTGDSVASRVFTGPKCGLCADGQWTIKRRGL